MQIPITRPGRGAKVWKRAAAKLSEGESCSQAPGNAARSHIGAVHSLTSVFLVTPCVAWTSSLSHSAAERPPPCAGTGKAIGSQHSDENLSEILVRVGTYFGRDPNVWTREGEQRTEVVEEGGKRVVKRMQKFMGWKLSLKLMMPLYDPRLKPVEGRPELDFSVESMMIAGDLRGRCCRDVATTRSGSVSSRLARHVVTSLSLRHLRWPDEACVCVCVCE